MKNMSIHNKKISNPYIRPLGGDRQFFVLKWRYSVIKSD